MKIFLSVFIVCKCTKIGRKKVLTDDNFVIQVCTVCKVLFINLVQRNKTQQRKTQLLFQ